MKTGWEEEGEVCALGGRGWEVEVEAAGWVFGVW